MKDTTYRPLLNLPPKPLRDPLDTLARHTLNHTRRVRHHNRHALPLDRSPDKPTGTKLINLSMRRAVQMQRDVEPLHARLLRPPQHRRVIAPDLCAPRAPRRRPVKLLQHQAPHRVHAVVHPRGQHVHAKGILVGRVEPQLRAGPVHLRAHVHGGARVVRRDPLRVEGHGGPARVDKHVRGDGRHRHEGCAVLHPGGVAVRSEDLDGGVAGGPEGLEALVGLLPVVEGRGHAVDADVWVCNELEGGPFTCLFGEAGFDVAVDWRKEGR